MENKEFQLRAAVAEDADEIIRLIQELADFEHASKEVELTAKDIVQDGFGDRPAFSVIVAEDETGLLGMALLYERYSTWKGKSLYLEDLIVTESARGRGIGKALLEECERRTTQGGFKRLEWQVLDWNDEAIEFYRKYGAELDASWINCRLRK